jgi:protein-S-isoprenylcysteine O-methyltransferase Ste14
MDTARYIIALLAVTAFPAAMLYWVLLHPFVRFWRRLGLLPSYIVLFGIFFAVIGAVYALRTTILAVDYGTNWIFVGASAVLFLAGMVMQGLAHRQLSAATFVGVPELRPSGKEGRLLQEGIYARVRHPRYVAVMLGTAAMALFTNYLAAYVLAAVAFPWLHLIITLEERELADRFGEAYREYQRRVPRLVPRRSRR